MPTKTGEGVKPATLYSLLVLVICLGACNIWLLSHLKHQDTLVAYLQYENDELTHAPVPGQLVPLVQGISLKSKQPSAVKLASSPQLVLLVFSRTCPFCEDNWKNWTKLFGTSKSAMPVYLISSDEMLPDAYINQHPLVKKLDALTHVDPEVLQAFNVASTPQTIYVVNGKVQRDWVGVLSEEDVSELEKLLSLKKS